MTSIMPFPLYDQLLEKATRLDSTPDIWKYITNLPEPVIKVVYALIWHHALNDNVKTPTSTQRKTVVLPYKGKQFESGRGMIFHVQDLPDNLQKIIAIYVELHIQPTLSL